ncbi:shikimate dehydrogenase [Azotosporobacter soli]|uniref:shikimate dehydrogenase n=1 Tax=Azotosporobacter soli TaxID=3055040 RepID=UPI0031FEE376
MIKGTTRLTGIIGWPIGHSFSPQMHNAAFRELDLDYAYVPLPVQADALASVIAALPQMGFRGVNVTIPHKVAVMQHLTQLDESARLAGAVNTIVFEEGRSIGYNTDVGGFMGSLAAFGVEANGANVLLLGAGGAARAVVAGMLGVGANVTIAARRRDKAVELAQLFPLVKVAACGWEEKKFAEVSEQANIIINSTPVGMHGQAEQILPLDWSVIATDAMLYDLIYNPKETPFLRYGRERGQRVLNGAGMLIEQGALAFALWTGRADCRAAMRKAMEEKE